MGLEVVLIRHAPAFERDARRWRNDRRRPLTPQGMRKFRRAAGSLAGWLPAVECLLTSPLVRTRQTAELLTAVAHWPKAKDCPELAPEGTASAVLAMLRTQDATRIGLVGHEPNLSALLSACVAGPDSDLRIRMKKGGIACISFPAQARAGKAVLTAIVPPRVLRRMR